jgi:Ca2+-binding RTX toxin-like protein
MFSSGLLPSFKPSRLLAHLKQAYPRRTANPHPRRTTAPRAVQLEPIEPRLLLSADIAPLSHAAEADLPVAALARHLSAQQHAHAKAALPAGGEQVFWLSTEGATDIRYDGPVVVDGIQIGAFDLDGKLDGSEQAVLDALLASLDDAFSDADITFTLERPEGGEFSTIHLGAGASWFDAWGRFGGLAEQIDTGNADKTDLAFVFTDVMQGGLLSAEAYGRGLAEVVAHEAGHLLGFAHDSDHGGDHGDGPLAAVAFDPKVHAEIGKDVLADVAGDPNVVGDADGTVTINGQSYTVHPLLVEALDKHQPYFNAGTVAGDGFPDVLMGQFAIHPLEHGTWLTRVLDMAWAAQGDASFSAVEKSQILAWSYGFLTHSAGDHFAHTLVNQFAEGVAPGFLAAGESIPTDQRDLANMLRHFMTEAYIADAMPGVDHNPERTLFNGDWTDNSTPGIAFEAPIRFIYETFIRPFADDPTPVVEMDWEAGTLAAVVDAGGDDYFERTEGSFAKDGFKAGHKITVADFGTNSGTFYVTAVSADGKRLFVSGALDSSPGNGQASGDESIVVKIAKTGQADIDYVVAGDVHKFVRNDGGSFVADGFVQDMRFSAFGYGDDLPGDFIVLAVSAAEITVVGQPGPAAGVAGNGNEQLIVYGQRGPLVDNLFKLRDALYKEAVDRGTRTEATSTGSFGAQVAQVLDDVITGDTITQAQKDKLLHAYLYNWVDEIDEGVRHWAEVGLAFSKAMFDPQSRRDLQNKVGEDKGVDSGDETTLRSKAEDGVGVLDVLIEELDDPNGDGKISDGFINRHLLSMIGLPPELGLLRSALSELGDAVGEVLEPITDAIDGLVNPIKEGVDDLKDYAKNWIKGQIEKRWGFSFETFDYLKNLAAKMDLKQIGAGSVIVPIFKPGDHEKLDAFLGLSGVHHSAPPAGYDQFPGVEFYPGAHGPLLDDAEFSKTDFAAYANAVTLTKLLLLMEDSAETGQSNGTADDQLSALYSDLSGAPYEVSHLNLHGAHGGNVMTMTLPGVNGSTPWMASIDADEVWRIDNRTVLNTLFRVSIDNNAASPASYEKAVANGSYRVYATWTGNVTQDFDDLTNSDLPDRKMTPTEFAQYTVYDGATVENTVQKNQRVFATDLEHEGLGFALIGEYEITGGSLKVELSNLSGTGDHVIAGPILLVPVAGGAAIRIQNDRDPETLVAVPGNGYSDNPAYWGDLVYEGGGGNNPLWESSRLRDGFRALFTDWVNAPLDFPALGDATTTDPNDGSVAKAERDSHATPFGPEVADNAIEVPITSSVRDLILDGLDQIKAVLDGIDSNPVLDIALPGIGKTLDELIDLGGGFDSQVRQPIIAYFAGDASPTFNELAVVIENSIGTSVDFAAGVIELDLYEVINDLPLNLAADSLEGGFNLDGSVDVELFAGFYAGTLADVLQGGLPKLGFGINFASDAALSADERFFILGDHAAIGVRIDASGLDAEARLGFLGAGVVGGEVLLEAAVEFSLDDTNGDGRTSLAELAGGGIVGAPSASGTLDATLPVQVTSALLGLNQQAIGTVLIASSDLFDPDALTVDFDFALDYENLLDFDNLDAASFVGLLGQVTFWLDEFRNSDTFATLDLPLVGPALDSVLGFADAFRDKLLIDDADDGVDNATTLVNDVNAALAAAGLDDSLRAEIDPATDKLRIVANQAGVAFTVKGSLGNQLGFGLNQASAGSLYQSVLAAGGVYHDGDDRPRLTGDVTLQISVAGGPDVAVLVSAAATANNLKLGNDTWKLVNATNGATFSTVDELALKLADVLGVSDILDYDANTGILSFTLDLQEVIGQVDLPVDFSLPNLPDFLTLQTGGVIRLTADGALTLTAGVYLGDAPASSQLTTGKPLADLNGGIDIGTQLRVLGDDKVRTVYGQLSGDASFSVTLDANPAVDVTVLKADTTDNETIGDLIDDINDALQAEGLDSDIVAVANGLRVVLQKAGGSAITGFKVTAASTNAAVKDMGLAVTQTAAAGLASLLGGSALAANGRLAADTSFNLSVDGDPAVLVTVSKASTDSNTLRSQLVDDINTALAAAGIGGEVAAVLAGDRLRLVRADLGGTISVTVGAAALGLSNGQASQPGPLQVAATKDLAALRGRLSANTTIGVVIDGQLTNVVVTAASTATNRYAFDIVNDIQTAFDNAGLAVEVDISADRLNFTAADGVTSFSIVADPTAQAELGLLANGVGNSVDFLIGTRAGDVYGVTLDGALTLGDVISRIAADTNGAVTAAINAAGTGLVLTDGSTDSGGSFEVAAINGSPSAVQLGLVRADAQQGEQADGVIEGADIAGLRPLDRFFVQDVSASVGLSFSTPTLNNAGVVVDGDGDGTTGDDGLFGVAKVGFIGVQVDGGGTIAADLSLALTDPDGDNNDADGSRISLAELIGALDEGQFGSLVPAPTLTGGGQLLLDISVTPSIEGLTLTDAQIGIVVNNFGDPFNSVAPSIDFIYPNFGDLLNFQTPDFSFQSIIQGLQALADFLGEFEQFGFLDDPLPIVGLSVNDLIGVADRFASAVSDAQGNPASTLQQLESRLEQAFGLPQGSPLIDLKLVKDNNGTDGDTSDDFSIVKLEIELEAAFSRSLGINFDLASLLDLPDLGAFGGGADLDVSGALGLRLDFGFNPESPLDVYVFDTTGLEGTLDILGTDLTFRAAVGPLGVFVNEGEVDIGGSVNSQVGDLLPGDKLFRIDIGGTGFTNGRLLIEELDLEQHFSADLAGAIDAELPVYFPTDSIRAGTLLFNAALSVGTDNEFEFSATPSAEDENGAPIGVAELFAFDFEELSLLDQLLLGVDGVDLFLGGIQDLLDGEIGGVKLPLIGDKLAGAADVIGDLRDNFLNDLREAIEQFANPTAAFLQHSGGGSGQGFAALSAPEPDPVSKILGDLLGDAGLGLLADLNQDGLRNGLDVIFKTNFNQAGVDLEDVFFDWDLQLGSTLVDAGGGIDFDIGIPGLGLETKGDVELTIDWTLDFGFGLNYDDGFYFDVGDDGDENYDDDTELELTVMASVPGAGITGRLGFLQIEAEDDTDDGDGLETHLTAVFGIDIKNGSSAGDTKLGFSELGNIDAEVGIAAEAVVDLGMRLALNSDLVSAPTNFPSIVADFTLEWALGDTTPGSLELVPIQDLDGSFLKNGLQYVGFENVGLDLGSYFSELIGPIVNKIAEVTEPFKPFLDFLTADIPVISQLAGPTSLLDLAELSGTVNPAIIKAIEIIDQVVDLSHQLTESLGSNTDNLILYFDGFLPDGALVIYQAPPQGFAASLSAGSLPDLSDPNLDLNALADDIIGELDFLPDVLQDALGTVAEGFANGLNEMLGGSVKEGFSLPIIDEPSQIFGLLLGQPATLVQYDMGPLEFGAEYSAFFSLLGPLGVSINAEFDAQIGPLTFGYDTEGISAFAAGGFRNPLQLFDGFYVGDTIDGVDVPELQFDLGLWAAAELNLAVARGGVGGGLFAEIDFDLHDPDDDGRVRIKELATNVINEFRYGSPALSPLAIFDITGKLTAELFAFVKVDLFLFEIDESWHITDPITLLDFESDFKRYPTLATELGDGVLQLNMGQFSEQRIEGDRSDGDEAFYVKQGSDASHVLVWAPGLGVDESDAQEYEVTKLILALGGNGNDIIDLSAVTANIGYEIEGGAGDDVLKAGSGTGKAKIVGDAGNDTIEGSGGDDNLFGGAGNDSIKGEGGKDWIFGDGDHKTMVVGNVITAAMKLQDGNDTLEGGAGNDIVIGFGGVDTVKGDAGDDVLLGDGGVLTVSGRDVTTSGIKDTGKGKQGFGDTVEGGTGNDRMYGGLGNDVMDGGADDDAIFGEGGADNILGGSHDDLIHGGTEGDTIDAGSGDDIVFAEAGNDLVHGGTGNDEIDGGTGADTLHGDAGADRILGRGDPDKIYGGADDDVLDGGGSNDLVLGGTGSDLLIAGYGSDVLDGQEDPDTYKIDARGGSITDLSTAYDTGNGPGDQLILNGSAGPDTVLLRAMADSYFPSEAKLLNLIQKIFDSGEPDKLAAMRQAINDAYGPHSVPTGMIGDLTRAYYDGKLNELKQAIQANEPDPQVEQDLKDLVEGLYNAYFDPNANTVFHGGLVVSTERAIRGYYRDEDLELNEDVIEAVNDVFAELTATLNSLQGAISGEYETEQATLGANTDTAFVALINNGGANVERFNYRDMEGLSVNTQAGDDYLVTDDVRAATTINLGLGDDRVQVGQVFRSERVKDPQGELITGITAEDVFTTIEITRGWLSNGVSVPTTINGGDGNDNFTVFRNVAVLNLNGGDGDDVFTVRAFALKGSSDSERARTDMKGDAGADTILYVVNAPVGIDGGDGFDTVRIVGTEFSDDFVVTDSGIFGAGLNVSYVNIEKLVADGAEGDDRYFVLSTGLDVVTEIDGGLGSDTFFIGGNPSRSPISVISNDLRGHSGIILHSVESSLPGSAWDGIPVEGLSANVGDAQESNIIVTESGGRSTLLEGAVLSMGAGLAFDTYNIRLTRAPQNGSVKINVVPADNSPEDKARGYEDLEFLLPGADPSIDANWVGWQDLPELTFTAANFNVDQTVSFRARDDAASEGRRTTFINHKIIAIDGELADADYLEAQLLSVKVFMDDDDRDAVVVRPNAGSLNHVALEGGFGDSFTVSLTKAPVADVSVTMSVLNADLTLSAYQLTFTPANWDTAQTVGITAAQDAVVEGFHTDYISFVVSSADVDEDLSVLDLQVDADVYQAGIQNIDPDKATSFVLLAHRPDPTSVSVTIDGVARSNQLFTVSGNTLSFTTPQGAPELVFGEVRVSYTYTERGYDGANPRDIVVDLYDDDTPMVIIEPTSGSTDVIEDDPVAGNQAVADSYRIRLSRAPVAGEVVTINLDSFQTRTTYSKTTFFNQQVLVNGVLSASIDFDSGNWSSWQTITVTAIDDDYRDGNDTQVFAPDLQTVNKIRGPLIVDGAAGDGSLTLPAPLMMPHELNIRESDGTVLAFTPGAGAGAEEMMTVRLGDLRAVLLELQADDATLETINDLVNKTVEMTKGNGVGAVLDPNRPRDFFDRFWLITAVNAAGVPISDATSDDTPIQLLLKNPSAVDPTLLNSQDVPDADSEYAITGLSVNFFADEREQVDYLFVYDEDSVADDVGALTSADGVVLGYSAGSMVVERSALQRAIALLGLTDLDQLAGRKLEITVGPGTGRSWTITGVADGPDSESRTLTLGSDSGGALPTNRSEFRIDGSDRYGRITGFGMGPNIIFNGRPQPGGITYGDIEVVQMSLGRGNDTVRVDYAPTSADHATKRDGLFHTLLILDAGAGDDTVTVKLEDGQDGQLALSLGAGDDTVLGGESTLGIVVFGDVGKDDITTGSGDDIVFGDIGRVDYRNLEGEIITRLGHTEARLLSNPLVESASNSPDGTATLFDADGNFATVDGGLVGLMMQAISPEGDVQFRRIIANTANTLTLDSAWDDVPFGNGVPNESYAYRISVYPEDQTDGIVRGPRVVWSVRNALGDDDEIRGGGGRDLLIGGAGADHIEGNAGADWLMGDDARFDFDPVKGLDDEGQVVDIDGATWLRQATDASVPVVSGGDTLLGGDDDDHLVGGLGNDTMSGNGGSDVMLGDEGTLTLIADGTLVRIESTVNAAAGNDVMNGGDAEDILVASLGNDTVGGDAADDILVGDDAVITFRDDGTLIAVVTDNAANPAGGTDTVSGGSGRDLLVGGLGADGMAGGDGVDLLVGDDATLSFDPTGQLVRISTTNRDIGGDDTMDGNADDDILIGGAGSDIADGGTAKDLLLGDNATLELGAGERDYGERFRSLHSTGLLYGADAQALFGARAAGPASLPAWAAWAIELDPTLPPLGSAVRFGNDRMAGGAGDDMLFGQRGDDVLQGDGSRLTGANAQRAPGGLLVVSYAAGQGGEATSDGDDYIEGNAGNDVIFGNLGQDDLIGGSSTRYSLETEDLRDDGADLIFGGGGTAGDDLLRNDLGDGAQGRDADVIAGDNADILRIVSGGQYVNFNYDNAYGTQIVPRVVDLIDYTPGGTDYAPASVDQGAGDEIHGESGDDAIYGMSGNDLLFGEGHDDDVVGGWGHDWISGGTGQDGVIGDDGRIMTSRNSATVAEPLYGIGTVLIGEAISTPGSIQTAVLHTAGALKKTVNLTPFNVQNESGGQIQDPLFRPTLADDIIFGGWGDDFLHGGAGDDAMLGGEARATGTFSYATPGNNAAGNVLAYNADTGEFAAYDEYAPRTRIANFVLDFNANDGQAVSGSTTIFSDGNDAIFGDLGNDWLVGGTGRDNLYGGWGDDLLNADDDLATAGGANDSPDTHTSYEDRAFGGAGRDVLIGNTGGDRLIDWAGEFNSYIVPFAPFGLGTVSRTLQPQLAEFLYALSAADGADPTRAADEGTEAERNGEPVGELGLIRQQDAAWQDQTGAPADPQAGNIPGGPRDVLRSASFNTGLAEGLAADSGTWQVSAGALQVASNSNRADAVAVYHVGDPLPSYYEVVASIKVIKPTGGWSANSFIIFDYQSKTNFKFAGLDVSTNKVVMGQRTAAGWQVLTQSSFPGGMKNDTWYNLKLSVNGLTAVLMVNNQNVLNHVYQPTVVSGYAYGLNWGMVGFGSNQSRGAMDNIAVQVVPPASTVTRTDGFASAGGLFPAAQVAGGSAAVAGGRYALTPTGSDPVISLADLGATGPIDALSLLEFSSKLNTGKMAGVVFDRYSPTDYKFVAIDVATQKVVIGHRIGGSWVIDAQYSRTLVAGTDYTLGVTLRGSTVSVSLDGQAVGGFVYNAVTVDGRFGVFARGGAASFDSYTAKTNDSSVPAALTAGTAADAGGASASVQRAGFDPVQVEALLEEALLRWAKVEDGSHVEQARGIRVALADLGGDQLATYLDGTLTLDDDAAGHGWFVDASPGDDREFFRGGALMQAKPQGLAAGRIDMLSVISHELGHAMGLGHSEGGVMAETLLPGQRAVPESWYAAADTLPATPGPRPVIDWAQEAAQPRTLAPATRHALMAATVPRAALPTWQARFTTELGAAVPANPNAALKVTLTTAPELAEKVSML